jgi:hypothetical protein
MTARAARIPASCRWRPDQRALEAALIAWMPFLGLQARCQGRMKIGLKADFHAPLARSRPLTAHLQPQECIQAIKAALCAFGDATVGCPCSTHMIQRRATFEHIFGAAKAHSGSNSDAGILSKLCGNGAEKHLVLNACPIPTINPPGRPVPPAPRLPPMCGRSPSPRR